MSLLLKEEDVRAVLDMQEALHTIEATFRQQGEGGLEIVPRKRLRSKDTVFKVMFSANRVENLVGGKLYTIAGNRSRFLVVLFDGKTGSLKALIEADALGQIRTGAASGVATRYLARPDAKRVAIFGAGWQARSQLEAVAAVRSLEGIEVIGRDPDRAEAFSEQMTALLGIPVTPSLHPEASVRSADIVITATNAQDPVLLGNWLAEGAHLNLIGSNHPSHREADLDVFRRAGLVVVDDIPTAQIESGDLFPAIDAGLLTWDAVIQLGDIVVGKNPGRRSAKEITIFKSNGMAAEDVAVAARCYSLAKSKGIGQNVAFLD